MCKFLNKLIKCQICGQDFKSLSNHVRKHGLTPIEYKKQNAYLNYKDKLVEKINQLFVNYRQEWIHYWKSKIIPGAIGIRTNNAAKKESKTPFFDRLLTDRDLKQHLTGKPTIGVKEKSVAKYICFDIDIKEELGTREESLQLAQGIAKELIRELSKFVSESDIHVEYSGNKGYHVWVFFNTVVDIDSLVAFGKYVSQFNQGNNQVNIELRPESKNGKGVKLPLSYHYKTGDFCSFVDKQNFSPVADSYEYFLDIKQIPPIDFRPFTQAAKEVKVIEQLTSSPVKICKSEPSPVIMRDRTHLKEVWERGLPCTGVRHEYTLLLAIWLKEQGHDRESIKTMLHEFTEREYSHGRTKDDANKSSADINSTVNNVFNKNYTLKNTELSDFEKSIFKFFPKKVHKTLESILRITKFAPDNNGFLYISAEYIAKDIGQSKRNVERHIAEMEGKILFRMFRGIPQQKLAKERRELVNKLPTVIVQEMEKYGLLEKFINPEKGLSSLYYLPMITGNFCKVINNPADFILLVKYSWSRFRLAYINSEQIYYKHKIIQGMRDNEFIREVYKIKSQRIANFFKSEILALKVEIGSLESIFIERILWKLLFNYIYEKYKPKCSQ